MCVYSHRINFELDLNTAMTFFFFRLFIENVFLFQIISFAVRPNFFDMPYDYALWLPGGSFKKSDLINFICVVSFHILPAILIDCLAFLARFPPL